MRLTVQRIIAMFLLVIPGLIACFGFLKVKDSLYDYYISFGIEGVDPSLQWWKLILGLIMFVAGTGFIAGWTFFRDRKRNYVATRFKVKREKPPKPTKSSQ
ncbi:MAG: DUF2627 domain-containing protein [Candidatus Pristimantibacillus lignocellulolyticus]|uniref:DUF2627 domain-containing protein n=1 Tax=Candidatus Pristimantibacillus lignocellulolyticus TaxID=2994561 RepID=A0A9J6ZDI1_9BACL|nr:MAG: DUF2627 domain-containing protein [Candidatus Pristimantibacillus lignocellulolyticus]